MPRIVRVRVYVMERKVRWICNESDERIKSRISCLKHAGYNLETERDASCAWSGDQLDLDCSSWNEDTGLQLGVRYSDSTVGETGDRGDNPPECEPTDSDGGRECWKDHRRGRGSPSVDSVMVSVYCV